MGRRTRKIFPPREFFREESRPKIRRNKISFPRPDLPCLYPYQSQCRGVGHLDDWNPTHGITTSCHLKSCGPQISQFLCLFDGLRLSINDLIHSITWGHLQWSSRPDFGSGWLLWLDSALTRSCIKHVSIFLKKILFFIYSHWSFEINSYKNSNS